MIVCSSGHLAQRRLYDSPQLLAQQCYTKEGGGKSTRFKVCSYHLLHQYMVDEDFYQKPIGQDRLI
jgi:hypothetical protein